MDGQMGVVEKKEKEQRLSSWGSGRRWSIWLVGVVLPFVVRMKTMSSPARQHNELSVHVGSLSRLSRNKQWPADNGRLARLSSCSSYIRATGMSTLCLRGFRAALWSVKNPKCCAVLCS